VKEMEIPTKLIGTMPGRALCTITQENNSMKLQPSQILAKEEKLTSPR